MFIEKIKEISNDSKYTKWYISIIRNAQQRVSSCQRRQTQKKIAISLVGGVEAHHILPAAISPENKKDIENFVYLSYREHFICHILLTKMLNGKNKSKMYYALSRVATKHNHTSVVYSHMKAHINKNSSIRQKQLMQDPEFKRKCVEPLMASNKAKRDADPKKWVKQSMGSDEVRAKLKEKHQSKEFREICRAREMKKTAEERSALGKMGKLKSIEKAIEKYGSVEAANKAHGDKIRGRVKIVNLETNQKRVVREPDFQNEFRGWVLLRDSTTGKK
jgi:hypothetical protein